MLTKLSARSELARNLSLINLSRAANTSSSSIALLVKRSLKTPPRQNSPTSLQNDRSDQLPGRISPPPKVVSPEEFQDILKKAGFGEFHKKND